MSTNNSTGSDMLLEVYGGKAFFKIYQCLTIGKIKFSFAKKDNPKDGIDCYVDAEDFIADFMLLITAPRGTLADGNLLERLFAERRRMQEQNSEQGNDIWTSRPGKGKEDTLRVMSIQPGSKTQFVFKAYESSAEKGQKGKQILVGFDFRELRLLAMRWNFLYDDYKKILQNKYSMNNMVSEFSRRKAQQNASGNTEASEAAIRQHSAASAVSSVQPHQMQSLEVKTLKVKILRPFTVYGTEGNQAMQVVTEDACTLAVICTGQLIREAGQAWMDFSARCKKGSIISLQGALKDDCFVLNSIA